MLLPLVVFSENLLLPSLDLEDYCTDWGWKLALYLDAKLESNSGSNALVIDCINAVILLDDVLDQPEVIVKFDLASPS
jgi:hypothetical protein